MNKFLDQHGRFAWTIGSAALLGAIMGCGREPLKVTLPPEPTGVPVTAEALAADFAQDRGAAAGKYSGKLLDVSGVIRQIETDELGWIYLLLAKDAAGNSGAVKCEMYIPAGNGPAIGSREQLGRLAKGKKATIAGDCQSLYIDGHVRLTKCSIVEVEPGPPPLQTEWEGLWDAVSDTYAGKPDAQRTKLQWNVHDDDIIIRYEMKVTDQPQPIFQPIRKPGTVQVNAKSSPKTFTLKTQLPTYLELVIEARGVYELAGDTLRVRYTSIHENKAPESLDDATHGEYFVELKRRQPGQPAKPPQ
jgi:uncharacterized protein (TIGR03067 family)